MSQGKGTPARSGRGWVSRASRRVSGPTLVFVCLGLLLIAAAIAQMPLPRPSDPSPTPTARALKAAVAPRVESTRPVPTPQQSAELSIPLETPAEAAVPTHQSTALIPPTATPAPLPPTRMVIPEVGVDAPVVPVSFRSSREEWEVPREYAVGWHQGTVGLGVPGNSVFNGHNAGHGEVFRDLYKLDVGDVITVYSGDVAFRYHVSQVRILPEAWQPREVRQRNARYALPTEDERLTLITCHPYGSLRDRLIVIARP